jgi:hypothetical protein
MSLRRAHLLMQTYKMIEIEIVNDQVFSQFIYKIIPDKVHMWTFKKQLNTQMALSGVHLHCPASHLRLRMPCIGILTKPTLPAG